MVRHLFFKGLYRDLIIPGVVCLSLLLSGTTVGAEPQHTDLVTFPVELGEIVYQSDTDAPRQLFIIANSHRSSETGSNGRKTLKAQVETFRMGEWLVRQEQLELLLPEGFFGSRESIKPTSSPGQQLTNSKLETRLADHTQFVNAELLLHEQYGVSLKQVEDRELYRSIRDTMRDGLARGVQLSPAYERELTYLQKLRSAALLQNAPRVIENAYQQNHISTRKAMLTIGLAHLDDIITFLKKGEIRIPAQGPEADQSPGMAENLALLNQPTGITIIVPRTLLDNPLLVLNDFR